MPGVALPGEPVTASNKLCAVESELEKKLRKQKELLTLVKSGRLKLPDGGTKLESNLKLLEREHEKQLTNSRAISPSPSATPTFAPALLSGLSFKPTSPRTDPLFIPSKRLSFESSLSLASASFALSPAPPSHGPPATASPSRFLELSREAETSITSPDSITPRRLRSDGKGRYQIRSGSLEPIGGAISRSALIEATQRARQALSTEVDAEALRFQSLLTIREDGGEEALASKGMEGVREAESESQQREACPEVVRRSIQLISVKEGSGRLAVQTERSKWYEDQIIMRSRMVNGYDPHEGPWERRGMGREDASSDDDSLSSEGSDASDDEI